MDISGRKAYIMNVELNKNNGAKEAEIINILLDDKAHNCFKVFDFFQENLRRFVPYKELWNDTPSYKVIQVTETTAYVILYWYVTAGNLKGFINT